MYCTGLIPVIAVTDSERRFQAEGGNEGQPWKRVP